MTSSNLKHQPPVYGVHLFQVMGKHIFTFRTRHNPPLTLALVGHRHSLGERESAERTAKRTLSRLHVHKICSTLSSNVTFKKKTSTT